MYNSYHEEKPNPPTDTIRDIVTKILIPLGTTLTTITILISKEPFPIWALWIIISYLSLIVILLLAKPVYKLYLAIRKKQNEEFLHRYFQPQLQKIVEEFTNLTTNNSSDTIPYLMHEITGWQGINYQEKKAGHLDKDLIGCMRGHIETIRELTDTIKTYLNYQRNTSFTDIVRYFGLAARDYNDICTKVQKLFEELTIHGNLSSDILKVRDTSRRLNMAIWLGCKAV